MAKLVGIAIKRKGKSKMELITEAELTTEGGLLGEYRGICLDLGRVIVIHEAEWMDISAADLAEVPWEARLVNIVIKDIAFGPEDRGKHLTIGEHIELEITGSAAPYSESRTEWQGGIVCRVVHGGIIKTGDGVCLK